MCSSDIFLGLLAFLFPPLPVWVRRGICSADSIINILLCMLGWLPGLLHAWYIIARFPEEPYEYERVPQDGNEGGRVTYVFVQPGQQPPPQHQQPGNNNKQQKQQHTNYGATTNNGPSPSSAHQPQQQGVASGGAGEGSSSSAPPPPTYAEAVKGDHKIQTQD